MSKGSKLSLLLICFTVLFMAALMSGVIKSNHWEVKNIEIIAKFKRVNAEQIRTVIANYPQRSFFNIKVNEIRNILSKIAWVETVIINKKWPSSLVIKVKEHKAVAVWNHNQLLNEKGEVFKVDKLDDLSALPHIEVENQNSTNIWDKFIRYNEIIKRTGFDISSAKISKRGGWKISLSSGLHIDLGSQHIDAKLVRLADTWSQLMKIKKTSVSFVDLRYTNGYVVKWFKEKLKKNEIHDTKVIQVAGNLNG